MTQKTAVEWIEGYLKQFNHVTESLSLTKAFEKAKKMDKEQKIELDKLTTRCNIYKFTSIVFGIVIIVMALTR